MMQQTALRLEGLAAAAPVVVCNEAHRFLVAEQLRQLAVKPRAIVLEPYGPQYGARPSRWPRMRRSKRLAEGGR